MSGYDPFQLDDRYRQIKREKRKYWAKITAAYIVIVVAFWVVCMLLFYR